jgi:hypothetical protein
MYYILMQTKTIKTAKLTPHINVKICAAELKFTNQMEMKKNYLHMDTREVMGAKLCRFCCVYHVVSTMVFCI